MSLDSDDHDVGHHGVPIDITGTQTSASRFSVEARRDGALFHAHTFDIRNAKSREAFAKAIATNLASTTNEQVDQIQIERRLLKLVDEFPAIQLEVKNDSGRYHISEGNDDPELDGIYQGEDQLSNFDLRIAEELIRRDGTEEHRQFRFRVARQGETAEFNLPAADYPNGLKFLSALTNAGGAKLQVRCRPDDLCRAVSALSHPTTRTVTTDFGWTAEGDVFLSPSVWIDATGVHSTKDGDTVLVDLESEESARFLDLAVPSPEELPILKRHFINDLFGLNVKRVTYVMAAAAALAVLIRFARGMNRPALWVTGLTGDGKSFLGRLFSCLFGRFPIADGARLGSWSSTTNYLQRQGYFFKDCLYLIDDYKPEVKKAHEATRILQSYADGSTRGRLRADATANIGRPIRGLLLSTGEDVPESSASSIARTVVVRVPTQEKDLERGRRCREMSVDYPKLMAGFIAHLLAAGRTSEFAERVEVSQDHFYEGIAGRQNDLRIAGNFGLLSAAFAEFARFLSDEWVDWQLAVDAFDADLLVMRDQMLAEVEEQQPSEVFLSALRSLIAAGEVRIEHHELRGAAAIGLDSKPVVGRLLKSTKRGGMSSIEISTSVGLKAVQGHLFHLAKPPLAVSSKALIGQLAASGKLLNRDGSPFGNDDGKHTWPVKIANATKNAFRVRVSELIDEPEFRSRGGESFLPAEHTLLPGAANTSSAAPTSARRGRKALSHGPGDSLRPDAATSRDTTRGETRGSVGQVPDLQDPPSTGSRARGSTPARKNSKT